MPEYRFKCVVCDGPPGPCELKITTPERTALEYPPDTCVISNCPNKELVSWEWVKYDHFK